MENIKILSTVEFENWEEKNENNYELISYLHGRCEEYVLEHYTPNSTIIVWMRYDDDEDCTALLHCFLKIDDCYMDVRGATRNIDDIYIGFEDWDIYDEISFNNIKDFEKFLKNLGLR